MKKLFGVAILAALPIACGTDPTAPTPSFPEAAATQDEFAASARVAPTCSEKADWASVKGVVVAVAGRGRGSVTVRADLMFGGSGPMPCYTAVFSVKPSGRGIQLQPASDTKQATLRAPDGAYEITVVAEGPAKPSHTASLMVEMPGK